MTKAKSTHNLNTAQQHALYRFYGETGQLLYVGITNDPGRRLAQHSSTKTWWSAVRGISLDWYSNRQDALAAETRAITVERPMMNVVRPGMPTTDPRRCGHCWDCRDGDACYLYAEREHDEDDLDHCPTCGRQDCLYQLGYNAGQQHGFSVAFDHYARGVRR